MNQILVILDTLRKDHVGAYGNDWIRTPAMDAFASDAVVFDAAYPESLPTIPVRRALATGIKTFPYYNYQQFKGDPVIMFGWQPIPEEQVTIAEILQKQHVNTALITDTYHVFKPSMNFHRGFNQFTWIRGQETDRYKSGGEAADPVEEFLVSKPHRSREIKAVLEQYFKNTKERRSEADYFAPRVFSEAMAWLEENHDSPFFLVVDSFDPHEPWDPPEPYRTMYPGAQDYAGQKVICPIYGGTEAYTPEELEYMRACYAGEVTMVDAWLGKFLQKVDDLGLRDSTMISIISDHGHQLGHHGLTGKVPWGLYPELVDLVLMVRGPAFAPRRVSNLVYNVDLTPTILTQSGILPGSRNVPAMDGRDLTPLLTGETGWAERDHVMVSFQVFLLIVTKEFAYLTDAARSIEELYAIPEDPGMFTNIATDHREICEDMYQLAVKDAGGPEGLARLNDLRPGMKKPASEWYNITEST